MLRKLTAVLALFMLMTSIFAPIAFGVVTGGVLATGAAKAPKCRAGTTLTKVKKRVRVTVKVRVHGKLKRKRVWKKRWVLVCAVLPPSNAASGDRTPPTTPSGLEAAPGRSQVVLVWNVSSDNVGVAGYRVSRNGAVVSTVQSTSFTDTGLANGTRYDYQVAAVDAAGNASAPATVSSTPVAPGAGADTQAPSSPPSFQAVAGDRQVALSWGASTDNVKVVYYELRRDGAPISFQEGTTFTDTGLVNGTGYAYTVLAFDQAGNVSVAATANATPADTTAPGTPTGLAATPGDAQVSLTWTAPTDNVAVTGYRRLPRRRARRLADDALPPRHGRHERHRLQLHGDRRRRQRQRVRAVDRGDGDAAGADHPRHDPAERAARPHRHARRPPGRPRVERVDGQHRRHRLRDLPRRDARRRRPRHLLHRHRASRTGRSTATPSRRATPRATSRPPAPRRPRRPTRSRRACPRA